MTMCISKKNVLLVLCTILRLINSQNNNSIIVETKKPTLIDSAPNFGENFPQFTPFRNDVFLKGNIENPENVNFHEKVEDKLKPFKNLVMGIYKNYKSTYLGNKTALEYMKSIKGNPSMILSHDNLEMEPNASELMEKVVPPLKSKKRNRSKKKKKKKSPLPYSYDGILRYNVGPGVNVSLDMSQELVGVNLDEDCLKDILTGRWDDDSDEGRGKKYDLISKILPLFILPFLIQSAIIPFLVSKLKLLLIKSIVVGKIAIFLLILSAFKNHAKMNSYEPVPAYYVDPPSRRSEQFDGYRVEGRPTTRVN